jgi:hypothetical protein
MTRSVIKRLAEAKVGDWVLLFDEERSRYAESTAPGMKRQYLGRGDYASSPVQITGETRTSWLVGKRSKYAKDTGNERSSGGFIGNTIILGEVDKLYREWVARNGHLIRRELESCRDAEKLYQIARMLNLKVEELPNVEA